MKRRQFITGCMGLATTTLAANSAFWGQGRKASDLILGSSLPSAESLMPDYSFLDPAVDREQPTVLRPSSVVMDARDAHTMTEESRLDSKVSSKAMGIEGSSKLTLSISETKANKIAANVNKSIDFAHDYDDDVYVAQDEEHLLQSVYKRLQRVQNTIGFGHFNLVSFDQAIAYSKRYADIGEFTQAERNFIEKIFFTDASVYGFLGDKVNDKLTSQFKKSETVKIPRSGHYILRHESLAYYEKLKRDVGGAIILTSGIRSNVKQLHLFLAKTIRVNGNLSRASRSLAPPGYSYHGIGDFDVGKVGWGAKNFTDDFASTDEFKRMQDLGYIAIRYDHGNELGVRFEPWHIKVV